MDFTIDQRVAAEPGAVQQALLDAAFVAATADLPRLGGADLLDDERDGSRVTLHVRRRFTGDLNRAVRAVVDPSKLTWVEVSRYDVDACTGQHEIVPDNYADRLSASYTTAITADGDGALRRANGRLTVRAPLGAGRVERAIVDGMREYADAEAVLLANWASRHG